MHLQRNRFPSVVMDASIGIDGRVGGISVKSS
jgi:hypothetical protein